MKTTKEHFRIFKEEACYWLEYFGLKDWSVHFAHKKHDSDSRADVHWRISGRVCTISLSTEWDDDDINEEQFRKSAFHEVCELLLSPLSSLAGFTFSHEAVQEQVHIIVRRLENTIFKERIECMIRKEKGGYSVKSEKGKNLGGPYKSKGEAQKRLKQVEYFKHKGK